MFATGRGRELVTRGKDGVSKPGVAVAVMSYAGKLNVTFSTDVHRVPDTEMIARAFDEENKAFCA